MQATYQEVMRWSDHFESVEEAFPTQLERIARQILRKAIANSIDTPPTCSPKNVPLVKNDWDDAYFALLDELAQDVDSPDTLAIDAESLVRLEIALAKLPPDYLAVIRAVDFNGRSVNQAAQELSCSEQTVRRHHARAHDNLREMLILAPESQGHR